MTDPYKVLGVSTNASDDDVKKAYHDLARKYHPDRYTDEKLRAAAEDKMKEINGAYEEIQNLRSGKTTAGNGSYNSGYSTNANPIYSQARSYINAGMLNEAMQILSNVNEDDRGAEWHFLLGVLALRKGNYTEAESYINTACNIDPYNMEYKQARNAMHRRASGYGGGYTVSEQQGCSYCDLCSTLICLNCLCRGCR